MAPREHRQGDLQGNEVTAMVAETRPERAIVQVDAETMRADLAITLEILNAEAKRISRRGKCGTLTEDYALRHRRIDAVLGDLLRLPE